MSRLSRPHLALLIPCAVVLIPRVVGWGQHPAIVDGDEMGFFALGIAEYAHRSPPWTFGPNGLPTAHLWLMGLADAAFGRDIWSARLVTALFGAVQALAIVAASFRLAGGMGALTAAVVLCLPLELHFERLNMCNVWTTATWSSAFALAVLAPWRFWSAGVIGALLAAGWYGYQSSRLVPLIIAAPLLLLLVRASGRQRLVIAAGVLSFALVLAPLAYGFWLTPPMLSGRAVNTSWLGSGAGMAGAQLHLQATLGAFSGSAFDHTAFFPYHLPLFTWPVMLLALVGVGAARSWPLALCLAGWIGAVAVGNFIRNIPVYSCVLICAVPAVAVAAGLSARRLRLAAPLLAAVSVLPLTWRYLDEARTVPQSVRGAMAHYRALQSVPFGAPLLVGGMLPCAHGFNRLHTPCFDLETPPAPLPVGAYAIVSAAQSSLADAIAGERHTEEWYGVPVLLVTPPRAGSATAP